MPLVQDILGHYRIHGTSTEEDILAAAEEILRRRQERLGSITDPTAASEWIRKRMAHLRHEEFHIIWLDTRHRIISAEALFRGTIDGCEVQPRVVVQQALKHNAAACILAHNHPSGSVEPSTADRHITTRLRDALALVDVRVLDHIVVGTEGTCSMAARGWV